MPKPEENLDIRVWKTTQRLKWRGLFRLQWSPMRTFVVWSITSNVLTYNAGKGHASFPIVAAALCIYGGILAGIHGYFGWKQRINNELITRQIRQVEERAPDIGRTRGTYT